MADQSQEVPDEQPNLVDEYQDFLNSKSPLNYLEKPIFDNENAKNPVKNVEMKPEDYQDFDY